MRKNCVVKTIEIILQLIAVISGFIAVMQMFKNHEYKKKLRQKAEIYLDEELGDLQNFKRNVSVMSPETIENETQIKNILFVTVGSLLAFLFIRLFTSED